MLGRQAQYAMHTMHPNKQIQVDEYKMNGGLLLNLQVLQANCPTQWRVALNLSTPVSDSLDPND